MPRITVKPLYQEFCWESAEILKPIFRNNRVDPPNQLSIVIGELSLQEFHFGWLLYGVLGHKQECTKCIMKGLSVDFSNIFSTVNLLIFCPGGTLQYFLGGYVPPGLQIGTPF